MNVWLKHGQIKGQDQLEDTIESRNQLKGAYTFQQVLSDDNTKISNELRSYKTQLDGVTDWLQTPRTKKNINKEKWFR